MIADKKRFTSEILPKIFKETHFASFIRRLSRWGFKRLPRGPHTHVYRHNLFERNNRISCKMIRHNISNSKKTKKRKSLDFESCNRRKRQKLPLQQNQPITECGEDLIEGHEAVAFDHDVTHEETSLLRSVSLDSLSSQLRLLRRQATMPNDYIIPRLQFRSAQVAPSFGISTHINDARHAQLAKIMGSAYDVLAVDSMITPLMTPPTNFSTFENRLLSIFPQF